MIGFTINRFPRGIRTAPWRTTHSLRPISTLIRCGQGFDPNPKPRKKPKVENQHPSKLKLVQKEKSEMEVQTIEDTSSAPVQREVPSFVADRMLSRIFIFSGVPVFIGLLTLPLIYYLKVVKDIDVPTWFVYITQILTFGGGLFGITYAILSTSPGRQEDFIGFETFKSNVKALIEK